MWTVRERGSCETLTWAAALDMPSLATTRAGRHTREARGTRQRNDVGLDAVIFWGCGDHSGQFTLFHGQVDFEGPSASDGTQHLNPIVPRDLGVLLVATSAVDLDGRMPISLRFYLRLFLVPRRFPVRTVCVSLTRLSPWWDNDGDGIPSLFVGVIAVLWDWTIARVRGL